MMTKKIKKFCLTSMLISISMFCHGQFRDLLIYKADTLKLISYPLKQYPDTSQINPRKMFKNEACLKISIWWGYISTWQIEKDSLYLLSIKADCTTSSKDNQNIEYADLKEVFLGRYIKGKVWADWFSGSLYCPIGKRVFVADDGYKTSYEKELELKIKNGMLFGEQLLDNSKSRQLEYDTLSQLVKGDYFNSLINWAIIPKISGSDIRVNVQFSANEDGIIDEVRVMRPRGDVFDSEAIRIVKTLPANVQIYHGKLRRQIWTMPVIFKESLRKK